MNHLDEIEEKALDLNESDRAQLASRLLSSLPAVLSEDDEGLAEATRRDQELESDPSIGMTTEQLRAALGR